jgi:hypothetical protein
MNGGDNCPCGSGVFDPLDSFGLTALNCSRAISKVSPTKGVGKFCLCKSADPLLLRAINDLVLNVTRAGFGPSKPSQ